MAEATAQGILLIDPDPGRREDIVAAAAAAVLVAIEAAKPELLGFLRGADPLLPVIVHAGGGPSGAADHTADDEG